jgi:hypothetical protein
MQSKNDPLFSMSSRAKRARFHGTFTPQGASPNRHERRKSTAGKNPHTEKSKPEWRRNAQTFGEQHAKAHPRRRTSGVVDPTAMLPAVPNTRGRRMVPRATSAGLVKISEWKGRIRRARKEVR